MVIPRLGRPARRSTLLLCVLAAAACAHGGPQPFVPDYALRGPGVAGTVGIDQDVQAVNYAAWAFADPARTRGNPAAGAYAASCMDYIAGALYVEPRWSNIDPLTKEQLLHGRAELRQALGIPPGAPSQLVVTSLFNATQALAAGDQRAALAALSNPAFPDPSGVLARVASLPYLQQANVGSLNAANELFRPNDGSLDN